MGKNPDHFIYKSMTSRYKDININYKIFGHGKTLVWLHGWGVGLVGFENIARRMAGFCHVLIDFPPFGKSEQPYAPFTLDDYAKLTLQILAENNIKKAGFVGHSFGGRVAILIAADYNKVVERVLLVDSAGLKNTRSIKLRLKKIWVKVLKFFKKDTSKHQSTDYKNLSLVMKATFSNITNQSLLPKLSKVSAPTLVLWGKNDRETPLWMGKKIKKKIKDSALVVFDGCGHFCYAEQSKKFVLIAQSFFGG